MKVAVIYHHVPSLPVETGSSDLASDVFLGTYRSFKGDYPHQLIWNLHDSPGRDIAAHQAITPYLNCDFAVFMSARVSLKRYDWLGKLVAARLKYGEGMYGFMASDEACPLAPNKLPNRHLRTCCFGIDPHLMPTDPMARTMEDGFQFESGEFGLSSRMRRNDKAALLVCVDGVYTYHEWRSVHRGFRSGDQDNLLIHDRHSWQYNIATPEQKAMLTRIADGEQL